MGQLDKLKKWAWRILMGITAGVFVVIFIPLLILKLILEFVEKFTEDLTLAGVVTIVILLICRG